MHKIFIFLFGIVILSSACNSSTSNSQMVQENEQRSKPADSFFPVTDFLQGQLNELESMPITPLRLVFHNKKTDSIWLKRENLRSYVQPFFAPLIDSASMEPYFSVKSFLDQTINAVTFTYDPKGKLPVDMELRHWDVYINPQTGNVERIYMMKESTIDDKITITQLTWKTKEGCSMRTIKQEPGKEPVIQEEKIIWNF